MNVYFRGTGNDYVNFLSLHQMKPFCEGSSRVRYDLSSSWHSINILSPFQLRNWGSHDVHFYDTQDTAKARITHYQLKQLPSGSSPAVARQRSHTLPLSFYEKDNWLRIRSCNARRLRVTPKTNFRLAVLPTLGFGEKDVGKESELRAELVGCLAPLLSRNSW